ncbi:peptide-binding protein [Fervidibacillus albus]|uniref:Peptide-binding protein n=2 Tax=Fervidibacillus albus TaxID=2980026 RepID=A0A9E8LZ14_9BACI|nr:peptide-binding protein [Fervidibacillus albus]WAA11349.1 peptide-binding protein [Fervidibacillus albus]
MSFLFIFGILVACSNNDESSSDSDGEGEAETESVLVGAMDTAPTGQFNPIFYEEAYEANILSFTHESLLTQNDQLEFEPLLAESWEFNEDHSSVTFKLREDVYWHDGEQFTADDVVFTYKAIADPDYIAAGGVRTSYVEKLVGAEAYMNGETDEFPGVVAEDDFTVTFNFLEPNVIALADASFPIIPEHVFKDIPVSEMPSAEESLQPNKVIGTGPYKFTDMIEGQEYHLTKNENYWQGEPQIETVIWKVVNQDIILSLLETGEIDFVADPNGFQAADYDTVDAMDHVQIIEQTDFGYQILGFIHNFRTEEDIANGVIDPDNFVPNEKLANKNVRQAIAFAIDRQQIIDGLLHGKGQVINSPIAQQFEYFDDENPEQYEFDPEKAKQLLDEAGYVDVNDDGFREDPDGNEWVLNMAYPKGNVIREKSAPIIEEMLEAVGININLLQPLDMKAYVDELTNNTEWDLYLLGWSLSTTDPDPSGLWTADDAYNFGRWNNEEADALVKKAITPPDAFDSEFRKQVYSDWQVMFQDDLPALILYVKNTLYAYNTRLQGVDPSPASFLNDVHKWYLVSEE